MMDFLAHTHRRSPLVVAVLALTAHLLSLGSGWIWDDDSYVTANPLMSSESGFVDAFLPNTTPQYYPLVFGGLWIQYAISGSDPLAYHLVNLLMHATNAALLCIVLTQLRVKHAFWIAAIFAVHPMGVETVAWVTERKNVQSMLFALASISVYLRYLDASRDRVLGTWLVSFFLFVCALLSKTTAIFVPPCLVLALLWMHRPMNRKIVVSVAPFFIAGIASGLFTAHVERTVVGAVGDEFMLTWLERLQLAGRTAAFYVARFAFPAEQIFIYPRFTLDVRSVLDWIPFLGGVAILAWGLLQWKRRRAPLVLTLWYGAAIFPALGFFDVWPFRYSFVADHFAYAAMPILAFLLVLLIVGVFASWRDNARIAMLGGIVLLLIPLSWRATAKYDDEETLWVTTAAQNPSAWIAHNNLAMIQLGYAEQRQAEGDFTGVRTAAEIALDAAQKAGALKPDEFTNAVNRSEALRLLGRHDEALLEADRACELAPLRAEVHWLRARLLEQMGRIDEARVSLSRCAELGKGSRDERRARLDLMRLAIAAGDTSAAIHECRVLIERTPDDADALANLGSLLAATGEFAEGRAALRRALLSERGLASEQAAIKTAVRYLTLAIEASLDAREGEEAVTIANSLLARTNGDPSVRYLLLALRFRGGELLVRSEIESLAREARAAGATEFADRVDAFLRANPSQTR